MISPYVYPAIKTNSVNYQSIINIICNYLNVPNNLLYKKNRKREVVECRFLVWYFIKQNIKITYTELGKRFNLSHCDVLHGIKQVEGFLKFDKKFHTKFFEIKNLIDNFGIVNL